MANSKPFRFTGFSGGLYASANVFDQPQGTVARISNLMLSERGGLVTVDGSHVVVRPGPPPAPLAFVSSGLVATAQPPAPIVLTGASTSGFAFTGTAGPFGTPTLPLTLTLSIPAGIIAGDVIVALISVAGIFPGVGASMTPITTPTGWTVFTFVNDTETVNVLWRVVDGTEGTTQNFVYPAPASNFAGYVMNGALIPIRGANTVSPFDVFQETGGVIAGPSCTAGGVTTTLANDLLLILMEPTIGFLTPGNVPGTTVLVNTKQNGTGGSSTLSSTLAIWAKAFAGPGATGSFTSPSGWPLVSAQRLVLAIGAANPPAGQLMGFPITSNGAITPAPIIQGQATALTAPQGTFTDTTGTVWTADMSSGVTGAIIGYAHPQSVVGNVAPTTLIQGPINTLLDNPFDVCVGVSGKIYVANYNVSGTGQILIYAAGSNGDVSPIASIGGGVTGLVHPRAVAVDAAENVYVLDDTVNSIKIWLAGHTGNVAPDQTIVGGSTEITNPLAIRIDPNNLLWITCGSTSAPTVAFLLQFATSDNGNTAPTTRIDSTALQPALGFGGPTGIAFDTASNIYVSVLGNKNVLVFPAGSSGTVAPTQTISGFPNGPWGIGVEQA